MRPPDRHHQQAALFAFEPIYPASPTTTKGKKKKRRTGAHTSIFHLQHSSLSYVRRRKAANKACLIINATDSQIIYTAVCHSHKELFDLVGGKISILLTDKQRRENTNHGNK